MATLEAALGYLPTTEASPSCFYGRQFEEAVRKSLGFAQDNPIRSAKAYCAACSTQAELILGTHELRLWMGDAVG